MVSESSLPRGEVAPHEWRWSKEKDPPFHQKLVHEILQKHISHLFPDGKTGRVFVPLCGKTLDMIYLAEKGHEVVGLEFSQVGVESFFQENDLAYTEEKVENANFVKYQVKEKKITIYRGDLFDLKPEICGQFDASWDRGSYVAINIPTRKKYAELMSKLMKPCANILMEKFIYDPSKLSGPPHFITNENLEEMFGKCFDIKTLDLVKAKAPAELNVDMDMEISSMLLTRR